MYACPIGPLCRHSSSLAATAQEYIRSSSSPCGDAGPYDFKEHALLFLRVSSSTSFSCLGGVLGLLQGKVIVHRMCPPVRRVHQLTYVATRWLRTRESSGDDTVPNNGLDGRRRQQNTHHRRSDNTNHRRNEDTNHGGKHDKGASQ